MKKQYIGPFIVDRLVKDENDGTVIIHVKGKKQPLVMPFVVFETVVSEKECDLTEMRDKKLHPVMGEIVSILMKYDVKMSEIDNLFLIITNFLNEKLDYSSARLWYKHITNKPEDNYVPGEIFENRTVNDINRFLISKDNGQNPSKNGEEKDKSSS